MTRMEANVEILRIISSTVEKYPDLRFGQILINLGISVDDGNDLFYLESTSILKSIKELN